MAQPPPKNNNIHQQITLAQVDKAHFQPPQINLESKRYDIASKNLANTPLNPDIADVDRSMVGGWKNTSNLVQPFKDCAGSRM
jgi:hypothetical protein